MDKGADAVLFQLKMLGTGAAEALAARLRISPQAARQTLERLERDGLVAYRDERAGRGRPRRMWMLTEAAQARFPETSPQLLVDFISLVREELGDFVLDKLIDRRGRRTLAAYQARCAGLADVGQRLQALAELRTAEGYMAAWTQEADGSFLLVENHCPICAAAQACQSFCANELAIFRDVLGAGWVIARTDHIVAGARRCAYRITPAEPLAA